jgi:DNA-binding MarR family transcriptional regulator
LRVSAKAAERAAGLSGAQLFVLHELASESVQSVSELSERTFTHQSSVSVVVSRLAERKLVTRTADREDARKVRISLTARGKDVLKRAPELAQLKLISALERLPPPARGELERGLLALTLELGLVGSDPVPLFFEDESRAPRAPSKTSARKRPEANHAR